MDDKQKKQIPLRLSAKLYAAIAAWAEDDFRSVNGQIEYLLTECVKQRKKNGKYVSDFFDQDFLMDFEKLADAKYRSELQEGEEYDRDMYAGATTMDMPKPARSISTVPAERTMMPQIYAASV